MYSLLYVVLTALAAGIVGAALSSLFLVLFVRHVISVTVGDGELVLLHPTDEQPNKGDMQ